MKNILLILIVLISNQKLFAQDTEVLLHGLLDSWHVAAARADFDAYFDLLDEEAIFIGTDATERWDKQAFIAYSKPHFDKGKAWTMVPLERHIIFSSDRKTVWFDELLDTSMKICRGSGVLVFDDGRWKIRHYVLSMTIPNDDVTKTVDLKQDTEDKIIEMLKAKK